MQTENTKTTGSIKTSTQLKKELAARSLKYNIENRLFQELFPELCKVSCSNGNSFNP